MIDFQSYFAKLAELIVPSPTELKNLQLVYKEFVSCKQRSGKILFAGNGGSAAISSHVSVDLSKNAGIRAINFNESDLITCLSNDRGYEFWICEALKLYFDSNDIVVLISSSGQSANVLNAARYCVEINARLITFTGMSKNNDLRSINSSGLNLHVDSYAYNYIENVHQSWLLGVVDCCIGAAEYNA